jgi:transposase
LDHHTTHEPRKSCTREYKLEAVRLTTEGGISVARAARDLGINENTLHKWRRQFRPGPATSKAALTLAEENRQLRRENLRLQQENTSLKRAAIWLAREAHGSSE